MKATTVVCSCLLIVAALGSIAAVAQNPVPFQHIVLIVQENRTPDNLFGAAPSWAHCGQADPFETGVDIQDGGPDFSSGVSPAVTRCLVSQRLGTCWDVVHSHTAWNNQADIVVAGNAPQARMDLACTNGLKAEADGCSLPQDCPEYSFVQKSDVQPYFDIATNYGFANYMFATNEGPSFPAHQFLLGGTSAPTPPLDPNNYYQYFVSENGYTGCDGGGLNAQTDWTDFSGQDIAPIYDYKDCYDHPTLVDLLDYHTPNPISWRYYAPTPGFIWTAVDAIKHLCYAVQNPPPGQPCDSADWLNMRFGHPDNAVPILTDIMTCQLQQMSWVIPDERWSDHAGNGFIPPSGFGGPSYVADIINAIGNSPCTNAVGTNTYTYWQDTAIFVVWDDWGGWYDHVPPPPGMILRQINGTSDCTNINGTWGCGYTYGFRVPLLVVSAYTKAGYVSGSIAPGQPGEVYPYIHDFGSILRFIEKNFGLTYIVPTPSGQYADYNAPDNGEVVPPHDGHVPLSDFFQWPYRSFVPVNPAAGMDADYFIHFFTRPENQGQNPVGPDGDDAE